MKKYFLRYLVYILLITLCSIAFLSGFTFYQYRSGGKAWKNAIYESCVSELEGSLKSSTYPDLKIDGLNLFGSIAGDKRISGYLVRNSSGAVILTVGQTPGGEVLASFFDEENITTGKEVKTKRRSIVINVSTSTDDVFIIERTSDTILKNKTFLPDFIDNNDILGSITVSFTGDELFSVDILSYSPRTYIYSKQIVNPILKSLLFSVPLSILIAIAGAYVVSSRNTRYINNVRVALRRLADGESDIEIPKYRHSELAEIGEAIAELDKSLQANKISRNAWLRSISHDLNTPVSAMKIIIDGLSDGFFDADEETLSELKAQNDMLSERIKRVIDYSTLLSETRIHKEIVATSAFTDSIIMECAADDSITFKADADEIFCDTAQMRRAVLELINNAKENSAEDGKIEIRISSRDPEASVISVKNKGSLPKNIDYNSLFEPWTKGTYSRSGEGNGLGLAIVGAIMHLHGGKASLKEEGGYIVASLTW